MTRARGVGKMDVKVRLSIQNKRVDSIYPNFEDCLHTTGAVKKMAECMQGVANLHEDNVGSGLVLSYKF
jgi:hypothetical protein